MPEILVVGCLVLISTFIQDYRLRQIVNEGDRKTSQKSQ
jgi:hypothetical protein